MIFSLKKMLTKYPYYITATLLEQVQIVRDLGIVFRIKLAFGLPVRMHRIVAESLRVLGFVLLSCNHFKITRTLATIYNAIVRSKLEYAAVLQNPSSDAGRSTILKRCRKCFCDICTFVGTAL